MSEIIQPFLDFWASHRYIEVETQFSFRNQKILIMMYFLPLFPIISPVNLPCNHTQMT